MKRTIEISKTKKGYHVMDVDNFTSSDFDKKGKMIGYSDNWFFARDFEIAGLRSQFDESVKLVLADGVTRQLTLDSKPTEKVIIDNGRTQKWMNDMYKIETNQ